MSSQPLASVVIPTHNRKQRLARVLAALEQQTIDPTSFEVVVVDDGSSDGTFELLQERNAPRLKPIRQQNGGPARARNAGVAAASGKYVVFIDDDVEPSPQLLAEHLRLHEASSTRVVIGPLSSLPRYAQPWVAWEQAKLEQQYSAMQRGDWAPSYRQFWTGNASLAREHLTAEGGFNVRFGRGEDVELGHRLQLRGLEFVFNPAATGFHHAERSLASWMHAHESYGRLEVEIFGRQNEAEVVVILRANWRRLHPATRAVVRGCLERPRRYALVKRALMAVLEAEHRAGKQLVSGGVCSVLANLLYWQASVGALGPELTARVLQS